MADMKVALKTLIENMYADTDSVSAYYCVSRNEFLMIDYQARHWVEDQLEVKDAPEWMREQILQAKAIEAAYGKDYYLIPDKYEIDEEGMMKRFAHRINDVADSREVMDALKGREAYRLFRKAITDLGLTDQWHWYRNQCYREIAIEWCQQHGLDYV